MGPPRHAGDVSEALSMHPRISAAASPSTEEADRCRPGIQDPGWGTQGVAGER